MIISASRRTDIPAFHSDWFYNRIKEGFAMVRNPMNPHQVSKVSLIRDDVECIVFWTKDPKVMLPKLKLIKDYKYYFQYTLNPYDVVYETSVACKEYLIDTFKELSEEIGPKKVIWRYDPIILNGEIDIGYHEKYFDILANKLHKHTSKCIISFVDNYKKTGKVFKVHGISEIEYDLKRVLAKKLSCIAKSYNLNIETCAEDIDLMDLGVSHAKCIDGALIESILGLNITSGKDKNQRKACGCMKSIDIGAYNTCAHACIYCYANYSKDLIKRNIEYSDVNSPLLCSKLTELDKVVQKQVYSCLIKQNDFFNT